jgi:hypothetical protein
LEAQVEDEPARALRELSEAREQLAATSEILRVISSSPTDVQPVFDTIVRSAVRLCDGVIGAVNTFDGELTHVVVVHNFTPDAVAAVEYAEGRYPLPALGRVIRPLSACSSLSGKSDCFAYGPRGNRR